MRVAWWLGGVAVLVGLGWLFFFSPVFVAESAEIRVEGVADYVDAEAVDEVLAGPVGVPLPRIDTVSLRDDLLGVRGVADATVGRSWPHGLDVEVTPRVPVAAVPAEDGALLLDDDGVVVVTVESAPESLPVIEIPVDDEAARARSMRAALVVLNTLPVAMRDDVRSVSAATQDDVVTQMRDGTRVEWGSADQVELKIAVLEELQRTPAAEGARTFDVSSPTRPITREG